MTLTGCHEVVTRMCMVWTRCCRVLSVGVCVTLTLSGGGDTDVCGVDKVLSGAVSRGLCDLDRGSGGDDTDVCCVDAVLSGAVGGGLCDPDRVSRGVTVVGDGDVSVAGGGELVVCVVVSGVDESVCGVNPVMTYGVLDLCGVDTVMSGVDKFVCSVGTVMTAGESDVCGGDSVVSGEAGELNEVDVFVCGEGPLVVGVGDCLSVVPDEVLCCAGVTRGDGGDAESSLVLGSGVALPGGVDGLVCVDGSLRPEPPPMHDMCFFYCILLAPAC